MFCVRFCLAIIWLRKKRAGCRLALSHSKKNEHYLAFETILKFYTELNEYVYHTFGNFIRLYTVFFMSLKELRVAYSNCTVRPSRFMSGAYKAGRLSSMGIHCTQTMVFVMGSKRSLQNIY